MQGTSSEGSPCCNFESYQYLLLPALSVISFVCRLYNLYHLNTLCISTGFCLFSLIYDLIIYIYGPSTRTWQARGDVNITELGATTID
jgi:hypothetical protein